jgi:hypothetical protein
MRAGIVRLRTVAFPAAASYIIVIHRAGADRGQELVDVQHASDAPPAGLPAPILAASDDPLSPDDHGRLTRAIRYLERPRLAMRLADYAGQPVNKIMRLLPQATNDRLGRAVQHLILDCLQTAIETLDDAPPGTPATWFSTALGGLTGGIGGLFGLAGQLVELPVTTVVMLRSIADIARHEGEDLSDLEARLACLEVFALGVQRDPRPVEVGYYAARALMARLGCDVTQALLEGRIIDASTPAVTRMVSEIAARFGVAVSERSAAAAVPVIGAVGGAAVNVIFVDHFQRVAQAHFLIRRLERAHGPDTVRRAAQAAKARMTQGRR